MTILVTGGAGFIGANFVHYQLKEHPEDRVVCLDALTYAGNLENLTEALQNPRFRFVKGDIADRETVNALFEEEKPDIVVNFAAESHVDRSITQPELFLRTNILGTQVLMDACRKVGVGRYHQVSTDEVYGDLPLDRPDLFFTEDTPIHTSSPYSASKAAVIGLTRALAKEVGPSGITVNCVAPGVIDTEMNQNLGPQDLADLADETPLCRIGRPEEVAKAMLFLASEGADFITGQVLPVNGGFVIT